MAIKKELLELAAFKSLCEAPLTVDEALQIASASLTDLFECGLSHGEISEVKIWFRREAQRMIGQSMINKSMIAESTKSAIEGKRLKEIIAEEIIVFEKRKRK